MRAFPSDRIGRPKPAQKKRKSGKKRGKKKTQAGKLRVFAGRAFLTLLIAMVVSWMFVLPFRWVDPPTTAFMLQDNSGRVPVLQEWSPWDELNGAAPLAVVAAEDQKFAIHYGFDLKSIRESIDDFNHGGQLRGASTISQQLAKNLYLWPGRSFLRKAIEAYFTMLLEATWPKKRILEVYLNVAEFGPGIYGVTAASRYFFRKAPSELSNAEAALLAAVLPNPAALNVASPSPYVRERQRWILQQIERLQREHWITLID